MDTKDTKVLKNQAIVSLVSFVVNAAGYRELKNAIKW
jgi:hypothetical protein